MRNSLAHVSLDESSSAPDGLVQVSAGHGLGQNGLAVDENPILTESARENPFARQRERSVSNRPRSTTPTIHDIVSACEDGKGRDVNVIHVARRFGLADDFVVVSGRSDRHVQGIAYRVMKLFEDRGSEPYAISGLEDGQWVVIDAIDVVVHVFYEPMRKHYDLEGLWAE